MDWQKNTALSDLSSKKINESEYFAYNPTAFKNGLAQKDSSMRFFMQKKHVGCEYIAYNPIAFNNGLAQ